MQLTIKQQLELENLMSARGREKFIINTNKAEEHGRGADTTYARRLMPEYLQPVTDAVIEYVNSSVPGLGAKYRKMIAGVEPEQAAYFALRTVFNGITTDRNIQSIVNTIGMLIEDEQKFTQFREEHREYYDTVIEGFKKRNTRSYRHKHRVLTMKANERGVSWADWTQRERAQVGVKMLDLIVRNSDLIEIFTRPSRGRFETVIRPTPECIKWIENHVEYASMLNPELMPCIIPPDPWTSPDSGGYYTPAIRSRVKLIKCRNQTHLGILRRSDLSSVMLAVNTLQATPWQVNTDVQNVLLDVWNKNLRVGMPASQPLTIPECPLPKGVEKQDMSEDDLEAFKSWKMEAAQIHTEEKERISKCFQLVRVMKTASAFKQFDKFYFPVQGDFRARLYCTSPGFSPQGPNFGKGVIRFANGKRIGDRGKKWFLIHGSSKYGYDKNSYKERIENIENHHDQIMATVQEPLSNRDFWGNADKPWQFLAWCYEYAGVQKHGHDFVSHLPIALDGTCNGLQHFSGMLRDPIGGRATNLLPGKTPADIYQDVADVMVRKLERMNTDFAKKWLEFGVTRKLTKKPVMTLPYGSTRQNCTLSTFSHILETNRTFFGDQPFQSALFLTPILWESIGEVVVAAGVAMDWLQDAATIMAKKNLPILWHTPIGFPAYHASYKVKCIQINSQINGRFQFKFGTFTDKLNSRKQRSGISPNFVHSMDASHMMMTVNAAAKEGINNIACIHDDYGTHACDTDRLQRIIREQFVELYTEHDPLNDFKREQEEAYGIELPPIPAKGSLDLSAVLRSPYFFG